MRKNTLEYILSIFEWRISRTTRAEEGYIPSVPAKEAVTGT